MVNQSFVNAQFEAAVHEALGQYPRYTRSCAENEAHAISETILEVAKAENRNMSAALDVLTAWMDAGRQLPSTDCINKMRHCEYRISEELVLIANEVKKSGGDYTAPRAS